MRLVFVDMFVNSFFFYRQVLFLYVDSVMMIVKHFHRIHHASATFDICGLPMLPSHEAEPPIRYCIFYCSLGSKLIHRPRSKHSMDISMGRSFALARSWTVLSACVC
jgi:hypothetical protein